MLESSPVKSLTINSLADSLKERGTVAHVLLHLEQSVLQRLDAFLDGDICAFVLLEQRWRTSAGTDRSFEVIERERRN